MGMRRTMLVILFDPAGVANCGMDIFLLIFDPSRVGFVLIIIFLDSGHRNLFPTPAGSNPNRRKIRVEVSDPGGVECSNNNVS